MSQYFQIHGANPQKRLIARAAEILRDGGVVVYPTDSCYALGCHIGNKAAMSRIQRLRNAGKDHHFTLLCSDLGQASTYAKLDNWAYRTIRSLTPGPYTFVMQATREVPKRLQNPRRKTIGIRIPGNPVSQHLLAELQEPIMSSTLLLPGDELPMNDPQEIRKRLESHVDLIIDGGNCGLEPTSVLDLVSGTPQIVRRGMGDVSAFE